jgi:ABC-type nitrate/sulfonate/bicarbonate transport system substrate-binding protein
VTALSGRRISASVLPVPDNFVAEKQAGTHTLVNIGQVMDAPLSGLAASEKTLKERPEQALALVRGALKGSALAKRNKAEAVALLAQFTGIDADTAAQAYDLVKDTWSDTGTASDDGIRNLVDPELTASLNVQQAVDWSLVRLAQANP